MQSGINSEKEYDMTNDIQKRLRRRLKELRERGLIVKSQRIKNDDGTVTRVIYSKSSEEFSRHWTFYEVFDGQWS